MPPPRTRAWRAFESRMPGPDAADGARFYVTGEVETTNGALAPRLVKAAPQGVDPKILMLTLEITRVAEIGAAVMSWRAVRFDARIAPGAHQSVDIRFGRRLLASIPVEVVF